MTSPHPPDGPDWIESTEGDLDPDLTEEAGYAGWEPRQRGVPRLVWQVIAGLLLIALVAPVVLQAVR